MGKDGTCCCSYCEGYSDGGEDAERQITARVAELETALAALWDADAFGPHPLLSKGASDE